MLEELFDHRKALLLGGIWMLLAVFTLSNYVQRAEFWAEEKIESSNCSHLETLIPGGLSTKQLDSLSECYAAERRNQASNPSEDLTRFLWFSLVLVNCIACVFAVAYAVHPSWAASWLIAGIGVVASAPLFAIEGWFVVAVLCASAVLVGRSLRKVQHAPNQ